MLLFSYLFKQFLGDRLLFFFGKKTTSAYCRTDRHVDKRAKKKQYVVADEGKKTLYGGKISKQGKELEEGKYGKSNFTPNFP